MLVYVAVARGMPAAPVLGVRVKLLPGATQQPSAVGAWIEPNEVCCVEAQLGARPTKSTIQQQPSQKWQEATPATATQAAIM